MVCEVKTLTASEVIYAVYRNEKLIHLGEGSNIARPAAYVQKLRRKLREEDVVVRYIEITETIRKRFPLPSSLNKGSFRGNLERLLQVAHVWQTDGLPGDDRPRGKSARCTGGFVQTVEVLPVVFGLREQLFQPEVRLRLWPTISDRPAESQSPSDFQVTGRPQTRDRYLAFWVDLDKREVYLGHVPLMNRQAQYSSGTVVWTSRINGGASGTAAEPSSTSSDAQMLNLTHEVAPQPT